MILLIVNIYFLQKMRQVQQPHRFVDHKIYSYETSDRTLFKLFELCYMSSFVWFISDNAINTHPDAHNNYL